MTDIILPKSSSQEEELKKENLTEIYTQYKEWKNLIKDIKATNGDNPLYILLDRLPKEDKGNLTREFTHRLIQTLTNLNIETQNSIMNEVKKSIDISRAYSKANYG